MCRPKRRDRPRILLCKTTSDNVLVRIMLTGTSLRLWIYRSLGVSLEQDEVGNYSKAIINNTKRGDVHVVNIDPKFSRWFYADYLWGTMQG